LGWDLGLAYTTLCTLESSSEPIQLLAVGEITDSTFGDVVPGVFTQVVGCSNEGIARHSWSRCLAVLPSSKADSETQGFGAI
jgi:hypothetical protein